MFKQQVQALRHMGSSAGCIACSGNCVGITRWGCIAAQHFAQRHGAIRVHHHQRQHARMPCSSSSTHAGLPGKHTRRQLCQALPCVQPAVVHPVACTRCGTGLGHSTTTTRGNEGGAKQTYGDHHRAYRAACRSVGPQHEGETGSRCTPSASFPPPDNRHHDQPSVQVWWESTQQGKSQHTSSASTGTHGYCSSNSGLRAMTSVTASLNRYIRNALRRHRNM